MRTIKFRVWYFKESRMINWDEMKDGTETIDIYLEKRCSDISKPMQLTGRNDKNGKESYKSDICNIRQYRSKKWEVGEIIETTNETGFHIQCYWGKKSVSDYYGVRFNEIEEFEIIGNIYEHPELLE